MAYITGAAASISDLFDAVVDACTDDGWTETTDTGGDTVLYNGTCYVRLTWEDTGDAHGENTLVLLGRTSVESGDAPNVVRMGVLRSSYGGASEAMAFPATYHIFTFSAEVYVVVVMGDVVQYLAWGQSDQDGLTGSGNWVCGPLGGFTSYTTYGLHQDASVTYLSNGRIAVGLFWNMGWSTDQDYFNNNYLHSAIDASYPWHLGYETGNPAGIKTIAELVLAQLNTFNSEAVLLPVRAYKQRSSSKISHVAELSNARHVRVDNYYAGQILTIGTDQWMVFPWYRKNTAARNGGNSIMHTGTYGVAIKYEAA